MSNSTKDSKKPSKSKSTAKSKTAGKGKSKSTGKAIHKRTSKLSKASTQANKTKKPKGFTKQPIKEDTSNPEDDYEEFTDAKDGLVDLYRGEEETEEVDMTTLDQARTGRTGLWIFIVVILMLSAVAAILGYLVFGPDRVGVDEGDVTLSVDVVESVASGDQLTMYINYENNLASDIDLGSLEIVYPQGFYFRSANPVPVDAVANTWFINSIPAGTSGTIEITGQLVGQKDSSKNFTVLFNYRPVNFTSDFQEAESFEVMLDESIINLGVTAPERARSGETVQYSFQFTNEASLPLTNVRATVEYPQGFNPITATPTADQGNNTWLFDEIDAGATEEVVIKGTIEGDSSSEHEFTTQVGLEEPDGFFNVQTEVVSSITLVNPELTMALSAAEFAQAGEEIEYTIDIQNVSDAIIEQIELVLNFAGGATETTQIDLAKISELQPNQEENFTQTVSVLPELPSGAAEVVATLSIISAQVDGATIEFDQTTELKTTLQSNIEFQAEARYYDDDLTQIGDGPLPPTVGEQTEYVIRWYATATGGSVNNISVQTTLPDGVNYISSNGDNRITHTNGTVLANFSAIPAGSSRQAEFVVGVTPSNDDVNKLLILTNDAVLTATDKGSGSAVQVQAGQVTSKLSSDPGATASDGTVIKEDQ